MPLITIQTVKGILDAEQKRKLHERITDLMVEIEGQGDEALRKLVWIKIEEQEPAHWSLGGMSPTTDYVAKTYGPIGPDGKRLAKAR